MSFVAKTLPAMGHHFSYKILNKGANSNNQLEDIIDIAHREVQRIEFRYSEFLPTSLISRINENAGLSAIKITPEDFQLFSKSLFFSKLSEGNFDISFRGKIGSYRDIVLSDDSIYLKKKGMKISLGGIGKGYAVDMAFNKITERGISNFIINGSGDIRVNSLSNAIRPWHIGIKNPFSIDKFIGQIPIFKGAVATSGNYIQKDHITCNRNTLASVTILSASTTEADVFGTTLFKLGLDDAISFSNKHSISCILIDSHGHVHSKIKKDVLR